MDILAHALWGAIVFHQFDNLWLVIIMSVLPDLASFVPMMIHTIIKQKRSPFSNKWKDKETIKKKIPLYVFRTYDYTHSLIISGFIFGVLFFTIKPYSFYVLPWMLHIILDIPSHEKNFFGTPIFYPISNFKIDGIPWSNKWFMIINYSLILILGSIVFIL